MSGSTSLMNSTAAHALEIQRAVWSFVQKELPPEIVGAILTGFVVWLFHKLYTERQYQRFREGHALYLAHQLGRIADRYRSIHAGSALSAQTIELKTDHIQRFRSFIGFAHAARRQIDDAAEFAVLGKSKSELSATGDMIRMLNKLDQTLTGDVAYLEARIDCQVSRILRELRGPEDEIAMVNLMLEPVVEDEGFTPAEQMARNVSLLVDSLLSLEGLSREDLDRYGLTKG